MEHRGLRFWCDAGLLAAKGIPVVIFGPTGKGLRDDEECVDVGSIRKTEMVADFCG